MKYFVFLVVSLSASLLKDFSPHSYIVIWNVGQGQWVTAVTPTHCYHFDVGGEYFPWQKIFRSCEEKQNVLSLSHWDWDHVNALSKSQFRTRLKDLCISLRPLGKAPSARKKALLHTLPSCEKAAKTFNSWTPHLSRISNEQSHVVLFKETLLPGDSPINQEEIWRHEPWVRRSKYLVLGHHGSATSTSESLLTSLPHLKLSISSARWVRYKHPHSSIELRLAKARIPLLRTEDWGNIWIENRF